MNRELLWSEFLALAREEAGIRVVETWFQALALYMWDVPSGNVYIRARAIPHQAAEEEMMDEQSRALSAQVSTTTLSRVHA